MSLPRQQLTTTCDIYRSNPPMGGSNPVATNVPCQLIPDYFNGARVINSLQLVNNGMKGWTHCLVLDTSADIRDSFPGSAGTWQYTNADTVYIPSGGSTAYAVVFVEVRGKGSTTEYKYVYLDRQLPNWPAL